jgi:hypothetical protein
MRQRQLSKVKRDAVLNLFVEQALHIDVYRPRDCPGNHEHGIVQLSGGAGRTAKRRALIATLSVQGHKDSAALPQRGLSTRTSLRALNGVSQPALRACLPRSKGEHEARSFPNDTGLSLLSLSPRRPCALSCHPLLFSSIISHARLQCSHLRSYRA